MGHKSFISEHSAEYLLVKNIVDTISRDFNAVVPIYFWSTREGGTIARRCMANHNVRILVAYARRPKIAQPDQDWLKMKINNKLFDAAQFGAEYGCPVLAGVPLVTNLSRLTLDAPCSWFHLNGNKLYDADYELCLSITGVPQSASLIPVIDGPLSKTKIIEIVHESSRTLTWQDAIDSMNLIRRIGQHGSHYLAGYRPFFIVIPVSMEQCSNMSVEQTA